MRRVRRISSLLCVGLLPFLGCHGGPPPTSAAAAWSDARGPEPSRAYEVWSSVYTVELQGTRNVRRHRGYLAHKTTRRHPEGYYEVLDTRRTPVGFITAGKAFLYENGPSGELTTREIAHEGRDRGILKILGVSGTLEFEEITLEDRPSSS